MSDLERLAKAFIGLANDYSGISAEGFQEICLRYSVQPSEVQQWAENVAEPST